MSIRSLKVMFILCVLHTACAVIAMLALLFFGDVPSQALSPGLLAFIGAGCAWLTYKKIEQEYVNQYVVKELKAHLKEELQRPQETRVVMLPDDLQQGLDEGMLTEEQMQQLLAFVEKHEGA